MTMRRPLKLSADRKSPYWFYGLANYIPHLNGERMEDVHYADEAAGVMDIYNEAGELVRHYGKVELREAAKVRLVHSGD